MNLFKTGATGTVPADTPNLLAPKVLWRLTRDSWALATPVFKSKQQGSVIALFVGVFVLSTVFVKLTVVFSYWKQDFFDAIQAMNKDAFWALLLQTFPDEEHGFSGVMPGFLYIVAVAILLKMYIYFSTQWLQLKSRTELTAHFKNNWLGDTAFYIVGLTDSEGNENPDQRISEDCRDFVELAIKLSLELVANGMTFFSFIFVLWELSGPITIYGVTVDHYMVFVAVLYAALGTWLTSVIGRPLTHLRNEQQKREADFRFALMRVRENAQAIALSFGAANENAKLTALYGEVVDNWWNIMWSTKKLIGLTTVYGQAASIFPLIVASPRYFMGAIKLGVLMQIVDVFGRVQDSLSWFVDSYEELAKLYAIVHRLTTMKAAIDAARVANCSGIKIEQSSDGKLRFVSLKVDMPDQAPLLRIGSQTFEIGQSALVGGRSGCGKSTLFAAIAGIWPYGSGTIKRPNNCMFLPQHPYMPMGSLAEVLTYPHAVDAYIRSEILEALAASGLGELSHELDVVDNWSQRLSGGQQQRVSIVRALLAKPDWLFLDESTASLDVDSEAAFFAALQTRLTNTTIISIAHRPEVKSYHVRHLVIAKDVEPRVGPVGKLFEVTE